MRRDQLEHAIRTACQIIGKPEVIVVGSQSILGTFREDKLPADATMSVEIDILPIVDDNTETERLADLIEGVAGEFPADQVVDLGAADGAAERALDHHERALAEHSPSSLKNLPRTLGRFRVLRSLL
jgi:hypothetical protein